MPRFIAAALLMLSVTASADATDVVNCSPNVCGNLAPEAPVVTCPTRDCLAQLTR